MSIDIDNQTVTAAFDAIRYNRFRGVSSAGVKSYVGIRVCGNITDEALNEALERLTVAEQIVKVGTRWLPHPSIFRTLKGDSRKPEFKFEDTWMLMCLFVLRKRGPATINDIIPVADSINRAIPTVDELHGALNRLLAARLITNRKKAFIVTSRAEEIFAKVKENCPSGLFDQMDGISGMLKCPCCGVRLKRVTWRISVTESEVESAYKGYSAAFRSSGRKMRRK